MPVLKREDTVGPFLLAEGEVHCGQCDWCYVGGTEMERVGAFMAHMRTHKGH